MTDAVQVALIVAVPTTIAAVGSFIVSLRNSNKLTAVHTDMNGKLSALLEAHGLAEHAKGVAEGRAQSIVEKQGRTEESERVEDRAEAKLKN